jgi:hypothetical protein
MKITGLNFIEAVQAAKEGQKVRRKDWVEDAYVSLRGEKLFYTSDNYDEPLESYYDHITATDWEIVLEPPKTMTFQEAIEHLLKHGKLITPDSYVKMEHGPVPDLCYNIIKFVRGDDYSYALLDESIKKEIRVLANHKLECLTAPDPDYLAETNIECLDEALNKYGKLEFNELSDLTHNDGTYDSDSIKLNEEITILDMAKVLNESGLLTEYLEDLYPDKIRQ